MIVATVPDGGRFYSNDAQLFSDGETTIYSPNWLPANTVLTSTELGVWIAGTPGNVSVQVVDVSSGYVFWEKDGLTAAEALELAVKAFDEYSAEEE